MIASGKANIPDERTILISGPILSPVPYPRARMCVCMRESGVFLATENPCDAVGPAGLMI